VGTSTRTPWIGETGRRGGIAIAKTRWSSDFVKDEWGFICESSAITSAGTSGKVGEHFRIWEEQRELQGPKSKSRGTETVMSPEIKFTKWERSGIWPLKSGSLVCLHFGGLLSICSNSLRHFC
jgi:hypothetical protein